MERYSKVKPVTPRPKPMKLLVLGLPRTGTTSICAALEILGLKSYHWQEMIKNEDNGHVQLWLDAVRAKYNEEGRAFVGEDFDAMLWSYDAVSDGPCCFFADELLAAYPDAKVLLTTRTCESWLRSMRNSIIEVVSWRSWDLLAYLDPGSTAGIWAMMNCAVSIMSGGIPAHKPEVHEGLRTQFIKHHDHIRKIVPQHKLLEFHPSQGWEPLCQFLNVPVPEESFPNLNQSEPMVQFQRKMYWSSWHRVGLRMAKRIGVAGLFVLAGLWLRGHLTGSMLS